MSLQQFIAIVRMRWQLGKNQLRKAGRINTIVTLVIAGLAVIASIGSFVFALGWSDLLLSRLERQHMMFVWDALSVGFLFMWSISMLVELQRTEMLSLKNLLHLPVSLGGGFFLNYLSSLVSLTLFVFLPTVLGLATASVIQFGSASISVFGLIFAFGFMITAVSYQLRGWLGRLMENKKTRGTVITVTTMLFVLVAQLPSMLSISTIGSGREERRAIRKSYDDDIAKMAKDVESGDVTAGEYTELATARQEAFQSEMDKFESARSAKRYDMVRTINACVPVGWLALGAGDAAQGKAVIPVLCIFGMTAIGAISLVLSYKGTLRVYTGAHNRELRESTVKTTKAANQSTALDRDLPLLTTQQSVVALATLRSTLRAPEAKMALLTPLIMVFVFGSLMWTGKMGSIPAAVRPLTGIGAIGMSMMGTVQMMLNMFGLDRQGFRSYVLMPAERRDILIGKNVGMLPISCLLTAALVLFAAFVSKMQLQHALATLLQVPLAYLIYSIISNYISTVAPIGMAVGTLKPVSMNFSVILMQFVALLMLPLATAPAFVALGAELLALNFIGKAPWYLLVTLVQIPLVIFFYRYMITLQGRHLQEREQAILDVISQVKD